MAVTRPPGFVLQRRNADQAQIQDQSVKMTRVTGRLLIKDPGEVLAEVGFPVYFAERPSLSFGAEMDDNFVAVDGSFPTVSVVVTKWVREERQDDAIGRFVGAELAVVTTGIAGQQMWVHWNVQGKALRNPVRYTSIDDEIGDI